MATVRPVQIAITFSALSSFILLACVYSEWKVSRNDVVLFDWHKWTSEQQQLTRKAKRLTKTLSATISPRSQNEEIASKRKDSHRASKGSSPIRRKTMPMDQALAMIKVQDQMRKERKFNKDRIDDAGDVAGVVSERDQQDMDSALDEHPDRPTKASRLFENCKDGSATVEDAELCQRRASAIRLLTRSAVRAQIAVGRQKAKAKALAAAQQEFAEARRELLAEAMRGGRS